MRGSRSIAALALAAAAALAVAGCNMAVPALYVIEGPGKRPAVFTLPEDTLTVQSGGILAGLDNNTRTIGNLTAAAGRLAALDVGVTSSAARWPRPWGPTPPRRCGHG